MKKMLNEKEVTKLYISTLGRAPDEAGLDYWANCGLSLEEVAKSFFDQEETRELYPSSTDNGTFINSVYANLFNRDSDKDGYDYWLNELDSSSINRDTFILAVINGAQNTAESNDAQILLNKTDIALTYANSGRTDATESKAILKNITDSPNTVYETLVLIGLQEGDSSGFDLSYEDIYGTTKEIESNVTDIEEITDAVEIVEVIENNQEIIEIITFIDTDSSYSNTNYGFGETLTFDDHLVDYMYTLPKLADTNYYFNFLDENIYDSKGFVSFTPELKDMTRQIFTDINDLINVNITESYENIGYNDISFNIGTTEGMMTAFELTAPGNPTNTDITLTDRYLQDYTNEQNRQILTHEIGHALGLGHQFEIDDKRTSTMSYNNDFQKNVITGINIEEGLTTIDTITIEQEHYALYDVDVLQTIYGINPNHNSEDNVYTTSFSDYELITISDAGGIDTLDFSKTKGTTTLDLRENTMNSVDVYSPKQIVEQFISITDTEKENLDFIIGVISEDSTYTGENNFAIAKGTIIENIYTGFGDDSITDNEVNNIINTGLGDDTIHLGNGGYDVVDGSDGIDIVVIDLDSSLVDVEKVSDGFIVTGDNFQAKLIGIEIISFNDLTLNF